MNKGIYETTARFIREDWTKLFIPSEYYSGRIFLIPTSVVPTFLAERIIGPVGAFYLFSMAFIVLAFYLGRLVSGSLIFSATLCFMFAFGTQLNYIYTFGSLNTLYVVLIYISLNFTIGLLLTSGRLGGVAWNTGFVVTLVLLALSTEWWLNYAAALLVAIVFGMLWANHHDEMEIRSRLKLILLYLVSVIIVYLLYRLQFPGQFFQKGTEEELILTYDQPILMLEDLIVNFFTFLYMSVTNYLPSFLTSSNSLTYLGPEAIIDQQHGYDERHQSLVLMSHIFMWRFYAGFVAALFLGCSALVAYRSWQERSVSTALIMVLLIMVLTGFSTHLAIKMRPYNSVPALTYKVVISVSALTVLIAYATMLACQWARTGAARFAIVGGVFSCVFVAAITRPGMQAQLLHEVGLLGLRDPFAQMIDWIR